MAKRRSEERIKGPKVCRNCRIFVEGDECPICHGKDFSTTWAGVAFILNPEASDIAKVMGVKFKGKYALQVR